MFSMFMAYSINCNVHDHAWIMCTMHGSWKLHADAAH